MNKKGITPVVSSVLLFVFAIGLGAIVMSWGATVEFDTTPEVACSGSSLELIKVGDKPEACYTQNEIFITLFNKGEYTIDGFKIATIGENDVQDIVVDASLASGSATKTMGVYERLRVGNPRKVIITPVVSIDQLCPGQSISVETLEEC